MLNKHITSLLNLEGIFVKKINHADNYLKIYIETKATTQICPCCHQQTKQIHDYRYQKIKDVNVNIKMRFYSDMKM